MNDNALKWKGRLGKMKGGCTLVLLFVLLIGCIAITQLGSALRNAEGPQIVSANQIVDGEVESATYVSITGVAFYEMGYEETEDGTLKATYYFMVDDATGDMVLIKHSSARLVAKKTGRATVVGMTHTVPSDLRDAIEEDEDLFTKNGLRASTQIYIKDGETPPNVVNNAILLILSGIGIVVCIVPFFFPSHVFAPAPLDTSAPIPQNKLAIKATGTFVKIEDMETLEIGKGTRKFTNAIANLALRDEHTLMIYIHYIFKSKTYGITVKTSVTDWAIFLNQDTVQSIESGVLYGWKAQPAVRITHTGPKGKPATAFIHLENAGDQVRVVNSLRKFGFQVYTGENGEPGM